MENKELIKEEVENTITSYVSEDKLGGKEELDKMVEDILSIFVEDNMDIKEVVKQPYLYDAQHPDRQKAIRIIESIPSLAKLNNEDYYAVEDKITEIINKKG